MNQTQDDQPDEELEAPPARWGSLWLLTFGPGIWAVHFLLCYVTAAVWCARVAGRPGELADVRGVIALYTLVAVIGIGLTAWRGYRQHSYGEATAPHDFDTPHDRHRFLGYSTLLLCGLSLVATVFVALSAVFIRTCE
jgi:hypothetical protein